MSQQLSLNGRIALVTGASRGIGRAVAVALAREGAHVVATARTTGALEELDDEIAATGGKATLLTLDLKKGDRVDQLGPALYQRWGRLDILVGAAGILGPLSPLAHVTADSWEDVMAINLSANWRLIRTLDPLLQRSDAGRVVMLTSTVGAEARAYWGPYAVSKAGLEMLTRTYALEVAESNVRANLVNPGPIRTAMRAKAFPGEDPRTLPAADELAPLVVDLCRPDCARNGELLSFKAWREARAKSPA